MGMRLALCVIALSDAGVAVAAPAHIPPDPGASDESGRSIQAHLRQGELAWRQSCPRVSPGDECVHVMGPSFGLNQCTSVPRQVTAFARDARLAARARRHFLAVASAAGRDSEARARALFYLAEQTREDFLLIPLPDGSANPRPKRSGRRFETYLRLNRSSPAGARLFHETFAKKLTMLGRAERAYLESAAVGQPVWAIAAHARIGLLYLDFDTQIRSDLRHRGEYYSPDAEPILDATDWLLEEAIEWFEKCVRKARETAEYGHWSNVCWKALVDYHPREFRRAEEMVPEADPPPHISILPFSGLSPLDPKRVTTSRPAEATALLEAIDVPVGWRPLASVSALAKQARAVVIAEPIVEPRLSRFRVTQVLKGRVAFGEVIAPGQLSAYEMECPIEQALRRRRGELAPELRIQRALLFLVPRLDEPRKWKLVPSGIRLLTMEGRVLQPWQEANPGNYCFRDAPSGWDAMVGEASPLLQTD
jgi:hypothetical protein